MNRVIKFRAWDKKEGRWLLGYDYPSLGGFSMFGEVMMMGDYAALISHRLSDLENIALMQFTGLTDKNGKEIYEGDVVRLNCGPDDGATIRHKILASIEWRVNRFHANIPDKEVVVKGGSRAGNVESWRTIHTWCGMHDCLSDNWVKREIIGNIYENSDLLK